MLLSTTVGRKTDQNSSCRDSLEVLAREYAQMSAFCYARSYQTQTPNQIPKHLHREDYHILRHVQAKEQSHHHRQMKSLFRYDDVQPIWSAPSKSTKTYLIEKTGSFSQNPSFLFQLALSFSQLFPTLVHLTQPLFMFLQLFFQFVKSILSTRTNGCEWRCGVERRDTERRGKSCDLRLEKTEATRRFSQSTEARCKRSLESRHRWVQLISS